MPEPEIIYSVRRADGELIGNDWSFAACSGPSDWTPAECEEPEEATTYELVKMTVEVVARRTLPECGTCGASPAPYWGLCEAHAREDDPDHFAETAGPDA